MHEMLTNTDVLRVRHQVHEFIDVSSFIKRLSPGIDATLLLSSRSESIPWQHSICSPSAQEVEFIKCAFARSQGLLIMIGRLLAVRSYALHKT